MNELQKLYRHCADLRSEMRKAMDKYEFHPSAHHYQILMDTMLKYQEVYFECLLNEEGEKQ